jgi:hypothetical protein
MSDQTPMPAASNTFEKIKRTNAEGGEFWSARDLARVLEYSVFRNFQPVIEKAKEACIASGRAVADHFAEIRNMVIIGSGAQREIEDWKLSRYACYLVIQNAEPTTMSLPLKPAKAIAQSMHSDRIRYFVAQAKAKLVLREVHELPENFPQFTPDLDERVTFVAYALLAAGCSMVDLLGISHIATECYRWINTQQPTVS